MYANCVDDQGSAFALYQPPAGDTEGRPPQNDARHGDLGYVTIEVRDSATTRAFYQEVLGWRFSPGRVDDGWGVDGIAPMTGLHGGHELATTVPMYRVDDIGSAIARIRAAGGSAPEPDRQPYGLSAESGTTRAPASTWGSHRCRRSTRVPGPRGLGAGDRDAVAAGRAGLDSPTNVGPGHVCSRRLKKANSRR